VPLTRYSHNGISEATREILLPVEVSVEGLPDKMWQSSDILERRHEIKS
jgi:hypothetical protein